MTTAQQLRTAAAAHEAEAAASFDRCDTDGFLSQWAHGMNAQLNRAKAEIIENGGKDVFVGLYQGDRRVMAKQIDTKFGTSWLLHESEEALIAVRGKPFLPTGPNSRVLASLGLSERQEEAPAYAVIGGSGKGLSGAATAFVTTRRAGDKWGQDAVLI
jgi:hypothetical protein